ncbi:MAG: HPF/RaiA family ribosome-associated protein [Patescibacteria group bacterium]
MQLQIKTTGLTLTPDIDSYLRKKLVAIEKLLVEHPTAHLFVELAKASGHHEKGNIYKAEFTLRGPALSHRAVVEAAALLEAIDLGKDELVEEIRSAKDKRLAVFKRGAQKVKEMLHRFNPWSGE